MQYELNRILPASSELGFIAQIVASDGWVYASGGSYHRATFLTSSDGKNFVRRNTPPTSGLRGVLVRSPNDLIVVGEYGTIARSRDHGEVWTNVDETISGCLYRIEEALGAIWVCGDAGLVLRSDDGGVRWQQVHRGGPRLLSIFASGQHVWFVGEQLLRFDGNTFDSVPTPAHAPLCKMDQLPDGSLLLVGDDGQMFHSSDGSEWQAIRLDTNAAIEDVAALWGGMLAVGSDGTLLFSDSGREWRNLGIDADEHFWCIAPMGQGALLGGNRAAVYRLSPPNLQGRSEPEEEFD